MLGVDDKIGRCGGRNLGRRAGVNTLLRLRWGWAEGRDGLAHRIEAFLERMACAPETEDDDRHFFLLRLFIRAADGLDPAVVARHERLTPPFCNGGCNHYPDGFNALQERRI